MSNLPALSFSTALPTLPAEVMSRMAALYDDAFSGLGGVTSRRIKLGKMGFILQDGQNQETIPLDGLFGVFVGSAPHNHAVWWEKEFAPGQEATEPDLVWYMPTMDTFPDALPHQFRKKIIRNGRESWAFQIMRRVAFCIVRNQGGVMGLDLERPYVMDLTSMSIFGKSLPDQNMYKWGGLRDVCAQYSTPGFQVLPSMFVTKIIPDATVSVQGVVLFMPMRNQEKQLQFLDNSQIMAVDAVAAKQSTKDLVAVREKLIYKGSPAPIQAAQQPPTGQVLPNDSPILSVVPPQTVAAPVVPPTQPVIPQPVMAAPAGTAADVNSLLAQAQAVLTQNASSPSTPVAAPTPVSPAEPSVSANIASLMAQLGG